MDLKVFSEIASHLQHPLVFAGFVIFLLFLICRLLVEKGLITKTFSWKLILGGSIFTLAVVWLAFQSLNQKVEPPREATKPNIENRENNSPVFIETHKDNSPVFNGNTINGDLNFGTEDKQ